MVYLEAGARIWPDWCTSTLRRSSYAAVPERALCIAPKFLRQVLFHREPAAECGGSQLVVAKRSAPFLSKKLGKSFFC